MNFILKVLEAGGHYGFIFTCKVIFPFLIFFDADRRKFSRQIL